MNDNVYVRCPECEHYLGSDSQYCCTTCWGSRLILLSKFEAEEGRPYYGSEFFDADGNRRIQAVSAKKP